MKDNYPENMQSIHKPVRKKTNITIEKKWSKDVDGQSIEEEIHTAVT